MKRSTERILTTHTGSLPRPADLLTLIQAVEAGTGDQDKVGARVRSAVAEIVQAQVRAGIDIVNDGEMGKPSYATYVKDRLTGFEQETKPVPFAGPADLADFPEYRERHNLRRAASTLVRPKCIGEVRHKDLKAVTEEVENLRLATGHSPAAEAFLSAASPGLFRYSCPMIIIKRTKPIWPRSPKQ
jgi:5-methyltetrahydropteroyltriglutamate--homocysteine methyltransferase